MEMVVHTEPTVEELRGLFRYLTAEKAFGFIGDDLREEGAFVRHFLRKDILPMVFEWGGQCIGVIWLSSYEPFPKSAFIHYAVSARHGREQLRAARAFLDAVLDGPNYDALFAVWNEGDAASARLSELFGFISFTRKDEKIFSMRI